MLPICWTHRTKCIHFLHYSCDNINKPSYSGVLNKLTILSTSNFIFDSNCTPKSQEKYSPILKTVVIALLSNQFSEFLLKTTNFLKTGLTDESFNLHN